MKKIITWILSIITILWIFGWIIDLSENNSNQISTNRETIEIGSPRSIIIEKVDFRDWPFTVESGKLWCDGSNVLFATNGKVYGINGAGKSYIKKKGGAELAEIWAIDAKYKKELMKLGLSEEKATVRLSISSILAKGLSLCQDK